MRNRLIGEAQSNIHERFILDVRQARLAIRRPSVGAMHVAGDDTLLLDEDAAHRMHKLVGTGALQEVAIDGLRGNKVKSLAHARFISELRPEDDLRVRGVGPDLPRHLHAMHPREVHIHHQEPWAFGQRPLDRRGAVSDFEHGTIVWEVLVE